MPGIKILTITFITLMKLNSITAQIDYPEPIEPIFIPVTTNKTTVLIMPSQIRSVDRGNNSLVAKTAKGLEHILKLKFVKDSTEPTSLHVFTADKKVYSFVTWYDADPPDITWDLSTKDTHSVNTRNKRQGIFKRTGGMHVKPSGIFFHDGIIYLHLRIFNNSNIPYPIHFVRFIIKDNRSSKRSSVTEKELAPIDGYPFNEPAIQAQDQTEFVLAFEQFTIASRKHLRIELFEHNGDRNIACRINGHRLIRAKPIKTKTHE